MSSFSQRKGLKPREKIVQIDSIDDELRNLLWNRLYDWIFFNVDSTDQFGRLTDEARQARSLAWRFWSDFLKLRSDEVPGLGMEDKLKEHILSAPWNEVL